MASNSDLRLDPRRLTAHIGAVIEGVDVRTFDDDRIEQIRRAVIAHRVVFVPDQTLDPGELAAFAGRFGAVSVSPLHQLIGVDRPVTTIEDRADRPPAGFDWHTDQSWTAEPPALGFLQCLHAPAYGGDTLWSDQVAIADALSPADRARCLDLTLEHGCDATLLASVERHHGPGVARRLREAHPPVHHPLMRRHPESGETALFLSPMYTRRLGGLEPAEASRVLGALDRLLTDPEHQVRWRWSVGDLAIWDERSTCHRALTDHHPQRRVMQRCTVAGTAPLAAAQETS